MDEERIAHCQKIPYVRVGEYADATVDIVTPKPEQIRIKDAALSMAKTCRFLGALPGWYSTAEHCILGARKASNLKVARQFMIHDVAEFVFGDIPSPVGRLVPDFKKLIRAFDKVVLFKYCGVEEFDPEVHEIDGKMCASEQRYIRKQSDEHLWTEPYPQAEWYAYRWDWKQAYDAYISAFKYFFPEVKESYSGRVDAE